MFGRVLKTGQFVIDVQRKITSVKRVDRSTAEWLKGRLQEMGPTYIKIGQFVSSRRDIFDDTIVDALRGLQDDVPPAPQAEMIETIKARLGKNIKYMKTIEIDPVACASIGQVHVGEVMSGKKVAIKVRRPGVIDDLLMDVTILMGILSVLDLLNTENITETRELLEDFQTWFMDEMNYLREVQNYKLLKANVNDEFIVMPEFYDKLCHEDFIVMSYVPSFKFRDVMDGLSMPERKKLAVKIMDTFVGQLVVDGVMHGDPHEGNVGIGADGRIVMYDMGNIIQVDVVTRTRLKQLLFEIVSGNLDEAVKLMKKINLFEVRDDVKVRKLLEKYAEYIKTVDVSIMLNAASSLDMRGELPIKFNSTVFRIVRVFGLLEGICKDLDPSFSYDAVFTKYMQVVGGDTDYLTYKMVSDIKKLAKLIVDTFDT